MNQSTTSSKTAKGSIVDFLFAIDSLTTSFLSLNAKDSRRRHSHNNRPGCDKV